MEPESPGGAWDQLLDDRAADAILPHVMVMAGKLPELIATAKKYTREEWTNRLLDDLMQLARGCYLAGLRARQ